MTPVSPLDAEEPEAAASESPSLQEITELMISNYADFLIELLSCNTMKAVDQLVTECPRSVEVNHLVQYVLALHAKGLVMMNTSDFVLDSLAHPLAKHISATRVAEMLQHPPAMPAIENLESLVLVAAASNVLGGYHIWPDQTSAATMTAALVPTMSSTVH